MILKLVEVKLTLQNNLFIGKKCLIENLVFLEFRSEMYLMEKIEIHNALQNNKLFIHKRKWNVRDATIGNPIQDDFIADYVVRM